MEVITDTAALEDLCQDLAKNSFVTVDLEFLREHHYYAQLCLIQLGSETRCAIVDPLAKDLDLSAFFELMQNSSVTKVFHSGRQDIEIIYNLSGKIPSPLFDTQVAAMVTGFGEAISYENLVSYLLHIKLDKSNRLSDWSKRPLSDSQLAYALSDVTHLVDIYKELAKRLTFLNRQEWIAEEMQILSSPKTYDINLFRFFNSFFFCGFHSITHINPSASWYNCRICRIFHICRTCRSHICPEKYCCRRSLRR